MGLLQHAIEMETGHLRSIGVQQYGLHTMLMYECVTCGSTFPAIFSEDMKVSGSEHMDAEDIVKLAPEMVPSCNGEKVKQCPWCRKKAAIN